MLFCVEQGIPHSAFLNWDAQDRAKVLAYKMEEAERCQMCGTSEREWAKDRFAYEPQAKVCQGCYLKDITGEDLHNQAGVTVSLIPAHLVTQQMREKTWQAQQDAEETKHEGLG